MRGFNRLSIQSKLMSMLLAVSVGSIAVIAYEGYRSGRNAIRDTVVNQLVSVRASKASQIESYFRSLRNEVQVLGRSPSTVAAMKELSGAFSTVLNEAQNKESVNAEALRFYLPLH